MEFRVEHECNKGVFKGTNEDAFAWDHNSAGDFMWMLVADGMGGHQAGDIASQMLLSEVNNSITQLAGVAPKSWPLWLEATFIMANQAIYKAAEQSPEKKGMGTTGVLLIICNQRLYVAWVGDSRAYLLRGGQLKSLTRDHSAINYLLDKGSISAKEAAQCESKHLLSRALGSKPEVEVEQVTQAFENKDCLMLSSDGLHDFVETELLLEMMQEFAQGGLVCEKLLESAISNGSRDNITLGLVESSH